jgi:hypothetical protein
MKSVPLTKSNAPTVDQIIYKSGVGDTAKMEAESRDSSAYRVVTVGTLRITVSRR